MKNEIVFLLLCVLVMNHVVCCMGDNADPVSVPSIPLPDSKGQVSDAEAAIVSSNNQFAFDMFSNLTKDPALRSKNIFFSPLSISSGMAVVYEGARSQSANEISSVFHYPEKNMTIREGYSDLYHHMENQDPHYRLNIANGVWAEKTYPFLPDYMNNTQKYYLTDISNLDLVNDPDGSAKVINNWVENATNGKITYLINEGEITPDKKLIVTNAIYFNGSWTNQFDPSKTREEDFQVTEDQKVTVPMMQGVNENAMFLYNETDDVQILEMPYQHAGAQSLNMIVLLPKNDDLAAFEERLNPQTLYEMRESLEKMHVNVSFPKLKMDTRYELSDILKTMGIRKAFSEDADFSGMDGSRNLYLGGVIHQGFVDINEKGTEAAGATEMMIATLSIRLNDLTFKADHPFIFIIRDQENGNILFIGRVINPQE